jgi:DNA-binding transcriptional regulator YiaG
MGKLEATIKSEIERLAHREVRRVSAPVSQDVRALKSLVATLRKSVSALERLATQQTMMAPKAIMQPGANEEELKKSRFSPRIIQNIRTRLGISQKELAILAGVSVGAIHQWESGKFRPKDRKKAVLAGLRKLSRRDVRRMLEERQTRKQARG